MVDLRHSTHNAKPSRYTNGLFKRSKRKQKLNLKKKQEKSVTQTSLPVTKLCRSRFSKKCIFLAILVVIIVVGLLTALLNGVIYHEPKTKVLIPPNPEVPLPASYSKLRSFKKAAVCSDAAPCSSIGRNILAQNGSAVDAAIATMFCNGIINMQSMGLGGGFLMTIYTRADKKSITLNARETAPLNSTPTMFDDDKEKAKKGPLAAGVPGELRGYWSAYKRYGKLPWRDLLQPTINLCENGYNMSKAQYDALSQNYLVKKDSLLKELFVEENGDFKKGGTLIKPTTYCETLRIIAENGGDDLYNGTLADVFVKDISEIGGIITKDDLEQYQPVWAEAISAEINNYTLYSVPPPGSGVLLAFILNVLKGFDFTSDSINGINNTISTYHKIIETFKYAYAKRTELGDSTFNNLTELLSNLTSEKFATSVREKIDLNQTYNQAEHYGAVFYSHSDHGTAHISVLAPNGDAVSVTSTVNLYFGAGVTSKNTGILLNSGMDDFSSKFVNYFGLPGSPANSIEPGKRSLSSMTPSIIVDQNGDVKMVIGAAGGTKITTAMALVIMRALWFNQTIKEAVDAPRFHHQVVPMEITYEYGILQQVIDGLEALGHKTERYRDRGSIICAMIRLGEYILANSDYRKGGDVSGMD